LLSKEEKPKSPKKKGKTEDKRSKDDTGDKSGVEPDSQESEELLTAKGKEEL
jgi:hypothetical protein